eukprot:gene27437-36212_t
MLSTVLFISLLASVSAFAPLANKAASLAKVRMSYDNEVGVLPPTGFFDPLGLSNGIDAATFKNYREAELKHGRVAMLAVTGYIIQAFFRLPGAIDLDGTTFQSIPNGVAAVGAISSFGWLQIVASIGYWELIGWEDKKGEAPGDFNFGTTFLLSGKSIDERPEVKTEFQLKELQNGRLAMLGIMALLTHDIAKPAGEGLFVLHHF